MAWTRLVSFRVVATFDKRGRPVGPVGQPRVKAYSRGAKAGVYTPKGANAWKRLVSDAWESTGVVGPLPGPFRVSMRFEFRRPREQYTMHGKGKNLRYDAPPFNDKRGRWDVDNCIKAILDALQVDKEKKHPTRPWADDASVVKVDAEKRYAKNPKRPGVVITIWTWAGERYHEGIPPSRTQAALDATR